MRLFLYAMMFCSVEAFQMRAPSNAKWWSKPWRPHFTCPSQKRISTSFSSSKQYDSSNDVRAIKHRRPSLRKAAAGMLVTLIMFSSRSAALAYDTAVHVHQANELLTVVPGHVERILTFRLIYAALVGSAVGWERAASKHSAGIRTMSLVSLGAATFTICSMYGFGGRGDPSRMASNVASGVGFLGAGVITTQAYSDDSSRAGLVSGLTTAAAIWLSAAVGVASGVGMYLVAGVTAALTIGTLRFGREKRKMIKKRIYRSRGTSELHDMTTWDEGIEEDDGTKVNVKPKRKKTIIKISRKLPSSGVRVPKNETTVVAEAPEDNLIAEMMEKAGGYATPKESVSRRKGKNKTTMDDDIQPLP